MALLIRDLTLMVTRRIVGCAALLGVFVLVTACTRPPTPAGALSAVDALQMGKDGYDAFDQPRHRSVPLDLCEALNKNPETVKVVGSLDASTRRIGDRTKRSPFSVPFLIDDALEDAGDAECHWSSLTTPQHFKISVEVTAYQKTPATKYARAAFEKIINDSTRDKSAYENDSMYENLAYERVALGSAACVAASGRMYYGMLRAENVLMAVTIYTERPIPADWRNTIPTNPVYAVLSVLNDKFGGGAGAPEQSPDEYDDCS